MSTGPRIRQPHGGSLRAGGTNKGGPGRPKSVVDQARTLSPEEAVRRLAAIASGAPVIKIVIGNRTRVRYVSPSPAERIKAFEALARLAGLTSSTIRSIGGPDARED